MKVSEKNIISIRKFAANYLLEEYDEERKLTHDYLNFYLYDKGLKIPNRVKFKEIKPLDILFSNVLLVKDETGKIIAYQNPLMFNEEKLLKDLNSEEKETIENARIKNLEEQGYYVTKFGDVVNPIEEIKPKIENENRYKKLINRRVRRKLC